MGTLGLLLLALLAGPVLAWAANQPGSRKAFERDKAKFEAGQGRDPALRPIGPHRSFAQNAVVFAVIVFFIGFAIKLVL